MKKQFYVKDGLVRGRISPARRADGTTGFQWFPFSSAVQPSRKVWDTPEQALKGRISGGEIVWAETPAEAVEQTKQ